MKSDIFFNQPTGVQSGYVPSLSSASKRSSAPQEPSYQPEVYIAPQEYSREENVYDAPEQAATYRQEYYEEYPQEAMSSYQQEDHLANRRAAIEKAFKSNVFEEETLGSDSARGARRHYGQNQHRSDIFHQDGHVQESRRERYSRIQSQSDAAPVSAPRIDSHSSSFSNIFGAAQEQSTGRSSNSSAENANAMHRVGGVSSNDLNRTVRGKGGRRNDSWNTSQIW